MEGSTRIVVATVLVLLAALGARMLGAPVNASLLFFVTGVVTIVLLAGMAEPVEATAPAAPAPVSQPASVDAFIEAIGEPLLIVSDGRVANANARARALLGQHIVGEDVRVAIRHPAAAERLAAGAPVEASTIDLVGLGSREQRWEMRSSPIDDGRRLVHLIDRTGSHAAEKMRVDFVANASHELRTPLATILGFVETLGDKKAGGDPATRQRFLRIMFDEARRMQRLVEDLMSLSRIEAEKYLTPDAAVDLVSLVIEIQASLRDGETERGKDIVTDLMDDLPFVAGDRAQLSQLIYNLVGNAMKYGRPDTPIVMSVTRGSGSMIRLSVADEGDGIAPEHLPRLTERFYRVDSSRSRALGGTGLGLAIVKHIVERHRGRLDIQSTVGKGTTVSVLLPPAPLPLSSKSHESVTERH